MLAHSDAEIWRFSVSLPDYMVSSHGRIMRAPHKGEMPNGSSRHYGGTATLGVLKEGRYAFSYKGKNYRVHRLVCEAFAGKPPSPKAVVMHLDENALNNRADNLAWGTQKQNLAAPGFRAYLRRRKINRLTLAQARVAKYSGRTAASIAREYGISTSTVSNIRAGRSWGHI